MCIGGDCIYRRATDGVCARVEGLLRACALLLRCETREEAAAAAPAANMLGLIKNYKIMLV